ncbi:unnamed protein product, partial [Mesorhabditis belari]|uniref:Ribosomal RNA-processing protein 12-like conserved domain-containing protein n=1 Tax=Mesorhabditis belari TaxID=2138241 RepID=A0AAF3EP08_9BILA
MVKFRHRIHSNKGTKLTPGHINDSNPARKKHRNAANAARKAELVPLVPVDEMLPIDSVDDQVLEQLNMDSMSLAGERTSGTGNKKMMSSAASMVSEGGFSQVSRFTTFTACTNPTFDVVHRLWKSGSSLQKEVLAVLSAGAEIIKQHSGTETDVEYYAVFLTTLESTSAEDVPRAAAAAFLLHLIVKKVSKEVLQRQFSRSIKILADALMLYSDSDDGGAVLKYLLATLGVVLRAQPSVVWGNSENRNIILLIASLCAHEKPRVRTMARKVVRTVLTDPVTSLENGLHAAAGTIGEYIDEQLCLSLEEKTSSTDVTRYLCLLEGIMHKMPVSIFQRLATNILKGLIAADSQVKCAGLQCLHRALQNQPSDAALSPETNKLLIISLRKLAPSPSEVAVCAYWIQALVEAHVCLSYKMKSESILMLPETMELITPFFQVGNDELCRVVVQVLSRLVEQCIQEEEMPARKLLSLLESSLTGFSAIVWKHIFKTMTFLFQISGSALLSDEFVKALRTMARLREEDSCFCKQEIDFTIGAAVRYVGVQHVLNVLSLQIDPDAPVLPTDFRRSWLLPIFRVNIRNAPLSLFIKYFLALASKLNKRMTDDVNKIISRAYSIVQSQLWDLLPSFLASASDFEESFPQLAKVLGVALTERVDLRLIILTGLRAALRFALAPDAPISRRETMARYAENYLPILFNLYVNDGDNDMSSANCGIRLSTLSAIGLYVEISQKEILSTYTEKAIERLKGCEATKTDVEDKWRNNNTRKRIADILIAFVKAVTPADVQKIFSTMLPFFNQPSDYSMQKKAYRILGEVLKKSNEPEIADLFQGTQGPLYEILLKSYDEISAPARAAHQEAVLFVVYSLDTYEELKEFCLKAIDLTILCLEKANSMPCREGASNTFQAMCTRLIEKGSEVGQTPSEILYPIFTRIFEMNTPKANGKEIRLEISRACLVALNILAQKHVKVLNASHLSRLISQGCSTLAETRPTIRVLGIRLIRVLVNKMPEFALQQYRDIILQGFFDQSAGDDVTSQVRKANRILLESFVDHFGENALEKYTDKVEWLKQIRNIVKTKRRKARKAAGLANEEGEENDDDDGVSVAGSRASARTAGADTILHLLDDSDDEEENEEEEDKRSQVKSVWLKEDEGDVHDLLDRNMLLDKVSTINPTLLAKREARLTERKKKNYGFAVTKDGKLIIDDDEEEEKASKRKKKSDDNDDLSDLLGDKKGKKGAAREEKDDYDEEEEDKKSRVSSTSRMTTGTSKSFASRYKPGGTGIHRDLSRPIATPKRKGKAGGDSIRKTQPMEPYAYVPLKQLKKKNRGGSQVNQEIRQVIGKRKKPL